MSRHPHRRRLAGFEPLEARQLCASDWQNAANPADVNGDGKAAIDDALAVIQFLRSERAGSVPLPSQKLISLPYLDVDGNQFADIGDVLAILRTIRVAQAVQVAAPSNLEGESLSPNQVRLVWQPSDSATSYLVGFVKGNATPAAGTATQVGNVLTYDLNELEPATAYRVAVFAQDATGRLSAPALVTIVTRANPITAPNTLANTTDLDLALRTGMAALGNSFDRSHNTLPSSVAWTISNSAAQSLGDSTPGRLAGTGYQFDRHATTDATGRMLYALSLASEALGTAPPAEAMQIYQRVLLQSLFQPRDGDPSNTLPENQQLVGIPGDTFSNVLQQFNIRYLFNVGGGLRGTFALATQGDPTAVIPEYGLSGKQIFEQTITNLRQYYVYDANGVKAYNWERFRQQFNLRGGNVIASSLSAELDADWSDINRTFADPQLILPLVQYYEETGYSPALTLATELKDLSFNQRFPSDPTQIAVTNFSSPYQMAAEMNAYGRLALVLNDADMLNRIRLRYEFVKANIATSTGWLPQTIGGGSDVGDIRATGELIQTALNLAAAGNPDYYDDAERFARGLLLPAQVLSPNFIDDGALAPSVQGMWGYPAAYGNVATKLPTKTGGLFADATASALETLTKLRAADYQFQSGAHYVNLLFNTDNANIRIVSPYPTGGNVQITTKVAGDVYFRLPSWALRQPLLDAVAAQGLQADISGSYLHVHSPIVGTTLELPLELIEDAHDKTLNGRTLHVIQEGNATVAMSSLNTPQPFFAPPETFDVIPVVAPATGEQIAGWRELGGPVTSGLVLPDGSGGLYAFAIGPNKQVFYRRARDAASGQFGNWIRTPIAAEGIDVAINSQGRPLLASATANGLFLSQLLPSGKWQAVATLPGSFQSVHFETRSTGGLQIFAVTRNGQLLTAAPNASGWGSLSLVMFNVLKYSVVERSPGLFDVFTMTPVGELYSIRQNADGTWGGPEYLRTQSYYIESFLRADGSETLLTIGDNNTLLTATRRADGTWTAWQSLGGVVANFTAGLGSDGRIQVWASLDDGQVWTIKETATGWSPWAGTGLFYIRQLSVRKDALGRLLVTARSASQSLWVTT